MQNLIALRRAAALLMLSMALIVSGCSDGTGDWTISNEVDAMTDVSVSKAITTIPGENFDLEVTVACGTAGKLAYQFRTFDKSGEPANLKTDDIHGSLGRIASVRIDDGKPYQHWDFGRFANQVMMTGREATDMAAGSKLVLRFRLVNGNETYTLDQSGSQVRSVFQGCLTPKSPAIAAPQGVATEPAVASSPDDMDQEGERGSGSGVATTAPTERKATCWTPPSGPNINDDPDRPISADEVREIETATGRPFEQGDSIYGRAEDRCPT